jgi:hypothetical protein
LQAGIQSNVTLNLFQGLKIYANVMLKRVQHDRKHPGFALEFIPHLMRRGNDDLKPYDKRIRF